MDLIINNRYSYVLDVCYYWIVMFTYYILYIFYISLKTVIVNIIYLILKFSKLCKSQQIIKFLYLAQNW